MTPFRDRPEFPAPVRTKRAFYPRFLAGEFGNRCRNWATAGEFLADPYRGRAVVRERRPGGACHYDLPRGEVAAVAARYPATNINEAMPDGDLLLQGEVFRDVVGLRLFASTAKKPMRVALREGGREWTGAAALAVLRHYLDPSSAADLEALLDLYDGHVVEFGTYARNVGDVPHRNTVVWEVRAY